MDFNCADTLNSQTTVFVLKSLYLRFPFYSESNSTRSSKVLQLPLYLFKLTINAEKCNLSLYLSGFKSITIELVKHGWLFKEIHDMKIEPLATYVYIWSQQIFFDYVLNKFLYHYPSTRILLIYCKNRYLYLPIFSLVCILWNRLNFFRKALATVTSFLTFKETIHHIYLKYQWYILKIIILYNIYVLLAYSQD